MTTKPEAPAPKPVSKRDQAYIDYLELRRNKLIAKRDAHNASIDAEVKDIDKKLLALLPE